MARTLTVALALLATLSLAAPATATGGCGELGVAQSGENLTGKLVLAQVKVSSPDSQLHAKADSCLLGSVHARVPLHLHLLGLLG